MTGCSSGRGCSSGDKGTRGPGEEYQGYDLADEDVAALFKEKYGYPPARVIVTGGAVLAGPIGVVG